MDTDPSTIQSIFEALLASLLAVLAIAWLSIQLAWRLQLVDVPDSEPHKLHDRPIPQAGGLALVATLLLGELLFGIFDDPNIRAALIAGIPVFIFGLWDDYRALKPSVKLLGQVAAAILLIYLGVSIRIFESPEFFINGQGGVYQLLDWAVTIFWVVGITNAFNFVDSMDGLLAGLGGMSAAFFMLITLDAGQGILSIHAALILGACIGLYFYNASPAMLFMGDSGAQTLGFILAALAIAYQPQGASQASSWFVPILLLGVPIFDATLVVLSRLRRKRPVQSAARDHTFHRLLSWGLGANRAVLVMQLTSLALGCLAYISLTQPPAAANTILVMVLLAGGAAIFYLERSF